MQRWGCFMARTTVYDRTEVPYHGLTKSQESNELDQLYASASRGISESGKSSPPLTDSDVTVKDVGSDLIGRSYKEGRGEPPSLSTKTLRVKLQISSEGSPPPLKKKSNGVQENAVTKDYRRASSVPLSKLERKLLRAEFDDKIQFLRYRIQGLVQIFELDFKTYPILKDYENLFKESLLNMAREDEEYKAQILHPTIRGKIIPCAKRSLNETQLIFNSIEEMSESDILIWKNKVVREIMPQRIDELEKKIAQLIELMRIIEQVKKAYLVRATAVQ